MAQVVAAAYRRILVPLDGSSFGEQALPYAAAAARRTGARLELVHVHELPLDVDGLALDPQEDEELRERERAYLDRAAAAAGERLGAPVAVRLLVGRAVPSLAEHVEEAGFDLVVMSTHGRGGLERAWVGSVADGLVRRVEVPLLLVRPTDGPADPNVEVSFDDVLVPLDGSRAAERILPHAAALGVPGRTRYTLLRVVPPELVVGGHVFRLDEERAREVRARAEAYLRRAAEALRTHGASVGTRVEPRDSPAAAILEAAREVGVDLVAMTTHGYGGLQRLLLGSVADKVLRGASVPLLLYRPDA